MPCPKYRCEDILAFQFSSWYPRFSHISIKSTIIRPLSREFDKYLHADGVFVPEGADDVPVESTLSDDEDENGADRGEEERERFAFPDLDEQIRKAVKDYGAVFPKLNFSSPKDAMWVLPSSSPLKCTSPADVYMLLKSSDFVLHDLDVENVFQECEDLESRLNGDTDGKAVCYELELVLRKWYAVDPSREFRCFVSGGWFMGISQRDPNHYEYLSDHDTQTTIIQTLTTLWRTEIVPKWTLQYYTFDVLMTRDLKKAHIVDFNPYAPQTDPLLFTYLELFDLGGPRMGSLPHFKFIDSRNHPASARSGPRNQMNMVPFEALALSSGRTAEDFAELLKREVEDSMHWRDE